MKNQNSSIDCASLVQDAKDFMDLACLSKFEDALHAISKRHKYSHYYYQMFIENLRPDILWIEMRRNPDCSSINPRDIFEAYLMAFIDNLHQLTDSFPYLLALAYPHLITPDHLDKNRMSIKWDAKFIKKFNTEGIFNALEDFYNDRNFNLLKELCIQGKHRYPIKLGFASKGIYFDDFNKYLKDVHLYDPNKPVKDYMADFHDGLLPKYYELVNLMHEDLKSRKMAKSLPINNSRIQGDTQSQ
jgi:hypothetical protein